MGLELLQQLEACLTAELFGPGLPHVAVGGPIWVTLLDPRGLFSLPLLLLRFTQKTYVLHAQGLHPVVPQGN